MDASGRGACGVPRPAAGTAAAPGTCADIVYARPGPGRSCTEAGPPLLAGCLAYCGGGALQLQFLLHAADEETEGFHIVVGGR